MPRIKLLNLFRLLQRGWQWSAHPWMTLLRSPRGNLFRITNTRPPGAGPCCHIEPYAPPTTTPDP
jgi:hypothetical protein